MTIEEATEKMHKCIDNRDIEEAHSDADGILCSMLVSLGYDELIDLYNQVPKWYA